MTTHTIDYFFAPQSPWTYLGHQRFAQLARQHGCTVRVLPVDLGEVFAVSGGLPLPKRAPQRQAYRLVELKRFSEHLGLQLQLHPRFFPVVGDHAARLIIAVDREDGADAAMKLTGAVLASVWSRDLNIASEEVLGSLLEEVGLPAQRLIDANAEDTQQQYLRNTAEAKEANVFGSPTYVVQGEVFWGQDRLDFLERWLGREST
jgi:2-hydroxychromene-2-carboxylate isomerase